MKLVIKPATPPKIRSLVTVHITKNTINVGTAIIIATKEPLVIRSFDVTFFAGLSVNSFRWDSAYKNQRCFIFGKTNFCVLSKYANATQPTEKSLNYVIPIILLVFFGLVYAMSLRADNGFVSFILIGIALVTIVYWTKVIKKMVITQKPKFTAREQETKNWVYDLIKGDNETVFVAEVPGPEDKIAVRLIDGVLYIRGSQGFSKEVQIEGPKEMEIGDFKYRNGVLTLRIKTSVAF